MSDERRKEKNWLLVFSLSFQNIFAFYFKNPVFFLSQFQQEIFFLKALKYFFILTLLTTHPDQKKKIILTIWWQIEEITDTVKQILWLVLVKGVSRSNSFDCNFFLL